MEDHSELVEVPDDDDLATDSGVVEEAGGEATPDARWTPAGVSDADDAKLFERWLDGRAKHVGDDVKAGWYYRYEAEGGPLYRQESPLSSDSSEFVDELERCRDVVLDAAAEDVLYAAASGDDAEKAAARKRFSWWEKAGNHSRYRAMLQSLMSRQTVRARDDQMDRLGLPVLNGVVEVGPADQDFSLSLRPRTGEDLITRTTAGRYVPQRGGDHEWWRRSHFWRYLEMVMPDEEVRWYFLKAAAYALWEEGNPEQLMFILMGLTGSGKSILNDRVREAAGELATMTNVGALIPPKDASGHSEATYRISGYRMVGVDDIGSRRTPLDNEAFKSITGTGTHAVRGIFGKEQEKTINFTIIATANRPLCIPDPDEATKRRPMYIPMNERISPDEGERYGRILLKRPEERDAIITILAVAYRRYLLDKLNGIRLGRPPAPVQRCTDAAWAKSQESVSEWAHEEELGKGAPEDWVSIQTCHARYSQFCYASGLKPLGKIRFTDALVIMGGSRRRPGSELPPEEQDNVEWSDGKSCRVLYGLKFADKPEKPTVK